MKTWSSPAGVRNTGPSPAPAGLAGQIARFGDLAGRDLAARASAAPRAREGDDPRGHRDAGEDRPLSAAEQLEMRTLWAAVTRDQQPAGSSEPGGLPRPARLRRIPPPAARRAVGRHHRTAGADPT